MRCMLTVPQSYLQQHSAIKSSVIIFSQLDCCYFLFCSKHGSEMQLNKVSPNQSFSQLQNWHLPGIKNNTQLCNLLHQTHVYTKHKYLITAQSSLQHNTLKFSRYQFLSVYIRLAHCSGSQNRQCSTIHFFVHEHHSCFPKICCL